MIKIETSGGGEVQRRLEKFFGAVVDDQQRAEGLRLIGTQLYSDVIRTFEAEGATQGRPRWEDLKAGGRYVSTEARGKDGKRKKRRFTTSYQILQDTGALRASFVPLHDETFNLAGVGAASIKEHADLALVHEFGNPSGNLPARPMLPTPEHAMDTAVAVYGFIIERAAQP